MDFLQELWTEPSSRAAIITAVLAVIGELLRRFLLPRSRIVWGVSHEHFFLVDVDPAPNNVAIRTRQLWVQNAGRATATNVQVSLAYKPQYFAIHPIVPWETLPHPHHFIFQVSSLTPRESITVTMLQSGGGQLPVVSTVRWSSGVAEIVPITPQQQFPQWANRLAVTLFVAGLLALLYLVVRLFA